MTEPRVATIEGRETLIAQNRTTLPASMPELLAQMAPYGFAVREDFGLAGTRTSCEVLRVHRFRAFREGRWFNPRAFPISGVKAEVGGTAQQAMIPKGLRSLRLEMCADCGAVKVQDITPEAWAGARPVRLTNRQTGETRVAPAIGQPVTTIGWYSGKRRAGREYR